MNSKEEILLEALRKLAWYPKYSNTDKLQTIQEMSDIAFNALVGMEVKMGYKFIESDTGCEDCCFVDKPMKWCRNFDCQSNVRADGKDGYFIEIEETE